MAYKIKLSSQLEPEEQETYNVMSVNFNAAQEMTSKTAIDSKFLTSLEVPPYETSKRLEKKQRRVEREKTKGGGWFNMPAGELTEEAKNDLELIKMRGALHKDRFYKSNDTDTLPKYFQMGTVVDDPLDYYTDRVPKKQQKKTILDELIEDAQIKKFAKKQYSILQTKEEHRRKKLSQIMKNKKLARHSKHSKLSKK